MYVCKYNNTSMITVYFFFFKFRDLGDWQNVRNRKIFDIFLTPADFNLDWLTQYEPEVALTCLRHQHTISVCNCFCTELAIIMIFVQKSCFCNFKWWHYQFCLLLWTEKIIFVVSCNWVKVWSRPIEVFFIYCP